MFKLNVFLRHNKFFPQQKQGTSEKHVKADIVFKNLLTFPYQVTTIAGNINNYPNKKM